MVVDGCCKLMLERCFVVGKKSDRNRAQTGDKNGDLGVMDAWGKGHLPLKVGSTGAWHNLAPVRQLDRGLASWPV